jgi:hypothetical protein
MDLWILTKSIYLYIEIDIMFSYIYILIVNVHLSLRGSKSWLLFDMTELPLSLLLLFRIMGK